MDARSISIARFGLAVLGGAAVLTLLSACEIEGTENGVRPAYISPPPAAPYLPETPPAARRVILLHTNDEHSHLLGFGPESEYAFLPVLRRNAQNEHEVDERATVASIAERIATNVDDQTVGGMARRQYLVNKIRSTATAPVLLLSAGDSVMGTLLHVAGTSSAPDQVTMALLGYDFMTLGNHDFDFGPDFFADSLTVAQNLTFGGAVPFIASNVHFDDVTDAATPGTKLEALFGAGDSGATLQPWATRTLANGLKVGLMGLMGYEAQIEIMSRGKVAFSTPTTGTACPAQACGLGESCIRGHCVDPLDSEGHIGALLADAQATIDVLRQQEDVDLVVALTHLGVEEDEILAAKTTGIDVIIGGHSHTELTPTLVYSEVAGRTIVVQAGSYGRKLGQLAVVVAPDGSVTYDRQASTLHDIDFTLDAEILAGTDLTADPLVLSPAFEDAITLTAGVLGMTLAGLDDELAAALNVSSVLAPVVASNHPVLGPRGSVDSNLIHLVTDADWNVVVGGACINPLTQPVIAVQANGVIRDDLHFGAPLVDTASRPFVASAAGVPSASFADVFRVVPLGASPFESAALAAPGLPLVKFDIDALQLLAGMNIGVTQGLASDSFFLSYAGARVTYDASRLPFDASALATGGDPGGRIVKIEVGNAALGFTTIYDRARNTGATAAAFLERWAPAAASVGDLQSRRFTIITNLYIAGFLDAFGIVPKNDAAGDPIDASSTTSAARLPRLVLCHDAAGVSCASGVAPCMSLNPVITQASITWTVPELKEWQALLQFLTGTPEPLEGGVLEDGDYAGDTPASLRVLPAP